MGIGLNFDEFVELKLMPNKNADRAKHQAAKKIRDEEFPMTLRDAASHLRTRGYDCRPATLEMILHNKTVSVADGGNWTRADVDAAAEHFEECELYVPYTEMCRVFGCRYADFLRPLHEAAERESVKYGIHVRDDDQPFVMHRMPPRRGELVDGKFVGGHDAIITFTLCDDVRERLERGEGV